MDEEDMIVCVYDVENEIESNDVNKFAMKESYKNNPETYLRVVTPTRLRKTTPNIIHLHDLQSHGSDALNISLPVQLKEQFDMDFVPEPLVSSLDKLLIEVFESVRSLPWRSPKMSKLPQEVDDASLYWSREGHLKVSIEGPREEARGPNLHLGFAQRIPEALPCVPVDAVRVSVMPPSQVESVQVDGVTVVVPPAALVHQGAVLVPVVVIIAITSRELA
ncbi:hypothetical protein TNCV_1728211 [Trichonephila clavipes]|nr:hypothetical protein TNCV_1728211 [Trichonephila clavipes]